MPDSLLEPSSKPLIVASILNWNQFELTVRCLTSLIEKGYPNLIVCVTDNHSAVFDEKHLLSLFPNLIILKNGQNLGYAGGHLKALDYALSVNAELIWLLNNDTVVTDQTLPPLLNAYNREGVAIYGSLAINCDGDISEDVIWGVTEQLNGAVCSFAALTQDELTEMPIKQVANVLGCSMLVPLSLIEAYGFIDTSFFLYFEETDYCLRLLELGVPSYMVSGSVIMHEEKASIASNPCLQKRVDYYLYRNLHRLILRHGSKMLAFHYLTTVLKRLVIANVFRSKHMSKVNRFEVLGVLHSYLGVTGKYYDPELYRQV
ncbi:glycosyltransferase family 2 protein [Arenicella xantha]|uniref:glycosyltransferase family 2 protein n=1 Tax=Arenicella xantha TaxID=644221 RepID=UPI001473A37F|nr:glycosyltransferase family 2 protein [Arenicella xantha]